MQVFPQWCTIPPAKVYVAIYCIHTSFINSLAPGKFEWNFRHVIFKQILVIEGWGISCEIALIWMSLDIADDQSTLVQVMAWCRQATSHYLSQCWPRSLSPYGITRPPWVNSSPPGQNGCHFGKQHFEMHFLEWSWMNWSLFLRVQLTITKYCFR